MCNEETVRKLSASTRGLEEWIDLGLGSVGLSRDTRAQQVPLPMRCWGASIQEAQPAPLEKVAGGEETKGSQDLHSGVTCSPSMRFVGRLLETLRTRELVLRYLFLTHEGSLRKESPGCTLRS